MRRQNNPSPGCRCYCANNDQNDSYYNNNSRKINVVETCTVEDDCCCRCGSNKKQQQQQQQTRQSSLQGENVQVDQETLQALYTMRQKACRFINSETENTTASDSGPRSNKTCQCQGKDDKYLIRIEDLLEYSPQSQFLKKLKRHFQGSPNDQSIPSILNEREYISNSVECNEDSRDIMEKASVPSKRLTKECKCCSCNQREKLIEKSPPRTRRSPTEKPKRKASPGKKRRRSQEKKEPVRQDEYASKNNTYRKTPKKSQHISRPRKPVKYRSRRKKRSEDTSSQKQGSQKQSSQETFEPSLKRPQEDSCERCWRYASPSRSPVNKPDQRYNPNFRRAHSWQDFNSVKDSTSEYYNSENLDTNTGPNKRQEELTKDFNFPSAQKPHHLSKYTSTRTKELDTQSPPQRASEKNYQSALSAEEIKKHQTPPRQQSHLYSGKEKKPRPKSYTPGASPRNEETLPSFLENLNCTEYIDIQTPRKSSPKGMSSSRSMRSNVSANSKMSPDQPEREKFFRKTKTKSSPQKKPKERTQNVEWLPEFKLAYDRALKECIAAKTKNVCPPKDHRDVDRMAQPSPPFDRNGNESVFPKTKAKSPGQGEDRDADWLPGFGNESAFPKVKPKSPGPREDTDAEWLPGHEFVSLDFNKPSYYGPNSQSNAYADTSRTPLSKSATNRSSSKYLESESSPKMYSQRSASPKNIYNNSIPISPQYCPPEMPYPAKSQSTHAFQNKNLSPQQRPRTVDHSDPRYTSKNSTKQEMREMRSETENQYRRPPHPFKPCMCGANKCQPIIKARQRDFSPEREEKKKEFCCHCRRNASPPRNNYSQNEPYQDRTYNEMPRSNEINEFEERYPNSYAVNACRCTTWQGPVKFTSPDGKQGRIVICPYQDIKPEKYTAQEGVYAENQKYYERPPNQNYSVYSEAEHRNPPSRRGQSFPNYIPTNYCVFYMKKNEDSKEDGVEVLVEELTEKPMLHTKKDCKTRALEDKMRKILETREESMALRFQKGVSEVSRVPESSRTLYF